MLARTPSYIFSFIFLYIISLTHCDDVVVVFTSKPAAPELPVLEGRPVELTCATNHPATIRWTLNGVEIVSTARRLVTQTSPSSSRLRITRVDRVADGGAVGCETDVSSSGKDPVKSLTTQLDITWLEHPVVQLESPSDVSGVEKVNDVTLLCDADVGSGDVQYHWYRNAERLTLKSHRVDIKKKRLHIKQATAKDNGVYRCSVHLDGDMKESKMNFVLKLLDPSLPQLVVQPEDILVSPKSFATFHCQYKSADAIEWFKNDNNVPFENGERVTVHKNGTLILKDITRRDEGFYTCAAYRNNEKTQLLKYSAKLKVAYLKPMSVQDFEPVISETRVVHAQFGESFRLTCLGAKETNPPALVMWKNTDNHLISDKGDIRVEDGTLVIETVKSDHQGVYSCVQENLAGSHDMAVYIVVNPKPKITKNPLDVTIDENQPCEFKCTVTAHIQENLYYDLKKFWNKIVDQNYLNILNGKPQHSKKHSGEREFPQNLANFGNFSSDGETSEMPSSENRAPVKKDQLVQKWLDKLKLGLYDVVWKREGGRIVREDQGRVDISQDGTLKFEKTILSDRGQYWCEAITMAGLQVASQVATLTIREKLKFSPPPVSKRLEMNSTGKVHCKVQGTPSPNVTWYQSLDSPLPEDVVSVNGTLLFSKVGKEHRGNYTCAATNTQGSIQNTIFIDVVVSPRFVSPVPDTVIHMNEGDPLWLHCVVEGDPIPKTQWDRHLQLISNRDIAPADEADYDRIKEFENGTLYIRNLRHEDTDSYGCTAGNSAGLKREEVMLVVSQGAMGIENEDGVITKAVLITMSVVGAYILLVVGLMLWCRIRRKRKLADSLANEKLENGELEMKDKDDRDKEHDKLIENVPDDETESSVKKKNKCNGASGPKPKNGSIANRSGNSAANSGGDGSEVSRRSGQGGGYDKLIVDKDGLTNFINLGRGEFGEVFVATLSDNVLPEESHRTVMVKSLQQAAQRDESLLAEFKRQLDSFAKLKHDNVASVIGLCNQSQPHYLIFQYTDWGDLKQFLLATRTPDEVVAQEKGEPCKVEKRTGCTALNVAQQLGVACHIARGMEAIADARILHKDLATRNCLLTSKLGVKVSMSSLTKDTYSKEYCKHVNQVIPLRWLPSECVYDSDYSTKSDVYMFACTLWEIFHKGELPFIKMNDTSVLNHLKNNSLTWKHHPDMPEALVELLDKCWDTSPKNRPTFNEISIQLHKILTDVKRASHQTEEE